MSSLPHELHTRDLAIAYSLSNWNTRVFLMSGQAVLSSIPARENIEGVLPVGHLACLLPWAADEITQAAPEGLSSWAWSSSLTTPTIIWNLPEVAMLMCRDAAFFQHLRSVQSEVFSESFFCWYMIEFIPLPLTSDGSERMNAITARILSYVLRG